MPDTPLVTVAVPVYNGQQYLTRALDSVLGQTFTDFELIVCDNASTDATPQIGARYSERDHRVRYHRNETNIGLAGNYNLAVQLARGRYFKWATHDDWHAPESLQLTVDALEEHPDASLCATGVAVVDEHGVEFDEWTPTVDLLDPPAYQRLHRLLWTMGETHPMYGLLRTSALQQSPLMRSYVGSDRTLLSAMALLGPFVQLADKLHHYTVSTPARTGYRPSLTYDPRNLDRLPLRTWRLIYEHLRLVRRSSLPPHHKAYLAGSVLARFGVRDARRLAAEAYHSSRVVAARARQRRQQPAAPNR